jgi:hypothetical protein
MLRAEIVPSNCTTEMNGCTTTFAARVFCLAANNGLTISAAPPTPWYKNPSLAPFAVVIIPAPSCNRPRIADNEILISL